MIAGDLDVNDYIRSPKNAKRIYVVKKMFPNSKVLVWRYDSLAKKDMENDFMFLAWGQIIEKVSI